MGLSASRDDAPPQEDGSSSGDSGHGNPNASNDGGDETTFTWNFGGQSVFVTGSWDNWEKKTQLIRNPATGNHSAGLAMPKSEEPGDVVYSYKFFVDGNWQCNPAQPTRTDERGNTNNYLTVTSARKRDPLDEPYEPVYISRLPSLASPSSSSSGGDVPVLPRLLAPTKNVRKTNSIAPHIYVDRLFCSQGDPKVKTLSLQSRYQAKIITTIFVTPA